MYICQIMNINGAVYRPQNYKFFLKKKKYLEFYFSNNVSSNHPRSLNNREIASNDPNI